MEMAIVGKAVFNGSDLYTHEQKYIGYRECLNGPLCLDMLNDLKLDMVKIPHLHFCDLE